MNIYTNLLSVLVGFVGLALAATAFLFKSTVSNLSSQIDGLKSQLHDRQITIERLQRESSSDLVTMNRSLRVEIEDLASLCRQKDTELGHLRSEVLALQGDRETTSRLTRLIDEIGKYETDEQHALRDVFVQMLREPVGRSRHRLN